MTRRCKRYGIGEIKTNDKLIVDQKVLISMQQQAVNAEKALRSVKLQTTSRTREKRLIELTRAELQSIPDDGRGGLYNGVGKMCVIV